MNNLDRVLAALARLRQETQGARDPYQRRRLESIERAIRKAVTGAVDSGEATDGGAA